MLGADFTCEKTGSSKRCAANLVQVCVSAFDEAAAGLDLSFSLREASFLRTAEGALPFPGAKPVAHWWVFPLACLFNRTFIELFL